ncbi:hypothetical protein VPHD148_0140 [Vibrio phage D148]
MFILFSVSLSITAVTTGWRWHRPTFKGSGGPIAEGILSGLCCFISLLWFLVNPGSAVMFFGGIGLFILIVYTSAKAGKFNDTRKLTKRRGS